jgi:hypothetical protein
MSEFVSFGFFVSGESDRKNESKIQILTEEGGGGGGGGRGGGEGLLRAVLPHLFGEV